MITLTSHPIQRAGAFAVAHLADKNHPNDLTAIDIEKVLDILEKDWYKAVRGEEKANDPRGSFFWYKMALNFFPNSTFQQPSTRAAQDDVVLSKLTAHRQIANSPANPHIPCILCGEASIGNFGRNHIPLGPPMDNYAFSLQGTYGWSMCKGCLISMWATPYAVEQPGGDAVLLHSYNDKFLSLSVGVRVKETRSIIASGKHGPDQKSKIYRELLLVDILRNMLDPEALKNLDVEVLIFGNGNQGAKLLIQELENPILRWIGSYMNTTNSYYKTTLKTFRVKDKRSEVMFIRDVLRSPSPAQLFRRAISISVKEAERGIIVSDVPAYLKSFQTYSKHHNQTTHGGKMKQTDYQELDQLATQVSKYLIAKDHAPDLKKFFQAAKKLNTLKTWFEERTFSSLLGQEGENVTLPPNMYLLLFTHEDKWSNNDYFKLSVLDKLHESNAYKNNRLQIDVAELTTTEEN